MEELANQRIVGVRRTRTIPVRSPWARVASFLSQPVNLVFLGVAGIIAFLGLYPSFFLLYGSFTDAPLGVAGHFTLANYLQVYANAETYQLVLTSFIFALGASALSVALASILAWITIRTNAPLRRIFQLTAIIPNFMVLTARAVFYYPSDMSVSANGRLAPGDRLIQSVTLFQKRRRAIHIDYAQTFGLVQLCQHALIGAPLRVTYCPAADELKHAIGFATEMACRDVF